MTDVIAHRGASQVERENTVAAFRRAVAVGADGIELDVRRAADGVLVCHHDARLADGRAIGTTDHADLPAHVPTLAAGLDACDGAWVNIEIKNDPTEVDFDPDDRIADEVVSLLAGRPEPPDTWLVSSFRLEVVDRCRFPTPVTSRGSTAATVATAWLTYGIDADVPAMLVERGHGAVHPWVDALDEDAIERCHAVGLRVNTWTCNDPRRARQLAGWGVDGICTDAPGVLRDVLGRSTRA